jgi:Co/Zn/Cd efflux system component
MVEHLKRVSDPSAAAVFLEDTAALIGLALALAALILHLVTGQAIWDALASIAIGILLMAVAWLLARRTKGLLVDESAPVDVLDRLRESILESDWISSIRDLQAIYIGPAQLLVTAEVEPKRELVDGPAVRLIGDVAALKDRLEESPAITSASVTLATPG